MNCSLFIDTKQGKRTQNYLPWGAWCTNLSFDFLEAKHLKLFHSSGVKDRRRSGWVQIPENPKSTVYRNIRNWPFFISGYSVLRLAQYCVGAWVKVLDARTIDFNPSQSSQGRTSRVTRLPAWRRWWRPWWTRSAWWPCPACTPASARPCASRKGRDPAEDGTIEDKRYIFFIFQPLYLVSGEAASFRGCTTCTVSKKNWEFLINLHLHLSNICPSGQTEKESLQVLDLCCEDSY